MSINKGQGQALKYAGILLDEPVFTHGQLYVPASRCGDRNSIHFFLNSQTANVVDSEVLQPTS
jgi:ATP-dependent DNA helicase PIF1